MSVLNAVYVDGESRLPQPRPTLAVSPAYLDGESGTLPILAYVATGGTFKAFWLRKSRNLLTPGVM
jgi:hypothetical protein